MKQRRLISLIHLARGISQSPGFKAFSEKLSERKPISSLGNLDREQTITASNPSHVLLFYSVSPSSSCALMLCTGVLVSQVKVLNAHSTESAMESLEWDPLEALPSDHPCPRKDGLGEHPALF